MVARFNTGGMRHHDRQLKQVLDAYADQLAAHIDAGQPAALA